MSDFGNWLVEMAPLDFEHNLKWVTMQYMAGHYYTKEQVLLARYYIADHGWQTLDTDSAIINGIDQHYDGGWVQFAEDSHGVQWDEIINIQ